MGCAHGDGVYSRLGLEAKFPGEKVQGMLDEVPELLAEVINRSLLSASLWVQCMMVRTFQV